MARNGSSNPVRDGWIWRSTLARATCLHFVRIRLADLFERALVAPVVDAVLRRLAALADEVSAAESDSNRAVLAVLDEWRRVAHKAARRPNIDPSDAMLLSSVEWLLYRGIEAYTRRAINPLSDTFSRVVKLSGGAYGEQDWRRLRLEVQATIEHSGPPPSGPDPFAISVRTTLGPDPAVQLLVRPSGFGPADYAILPYMLIHECICRALARHDVVGNGSVFAEGFMDWTAEYFYRLWLPHINGRIADFANRQMAAFREVRAGRADASHRRFGQLRATQLVDWISGVPSGPGKSRRVAMVKVANLALALNATNASRDVKDHFVSELRRNPTPALARRLMDWVEGRLQPADLLECTCTAGG
jgi:hypothetical protein